ncbi:50S ribosomal protein L10 [Porphyromonas crevioricanis]|uniref:Large ribosomal subunit protein uL10 n=2 Tax=Porphyromonas crevioricanis TaxID=393921 RepID=A0A0A2FRQ4_9PORP|nr:50S ribosomal protein L10 [Porphyromonas crevioricanis]KGN89649.1 50S ribosomal protein L10 [Porphyromonas crevioricanis]KGN93796.1 50S ribosomal protein L10 [Porphyromonas crevioricanis]SJZ79058.1 LSU ribosomal protein L10P [Porphyromonas crevioricanis]SQH72421.1 50S ribosomal protein L10 [Porphyromonas crevioricanis]GAD04705.1 LSU ribosomal protein L10p [Porphyromonas crevioricanis JCM 15906]
MKKEDKSIVIEKLGQLLAEYPHFYLVDIEGLNAEATMSLRRSCFKGEVKLMMVKNTLLRAALHNKGEEFEQFDPILKGSSALMLCHTANAAARIIKDLTSDPKKKQTKPALKGAYAQEGFYIGAEHLDTLVSIKSREELLAEVISLLESPIKNVVSSLQSAGSTIHGVLKTLEER